MDCNETSNLLDLEIDGELDLVHHLEVERHLAGCAGCARIAEGRRARKQALGQSLPRFSASPLLRQKIQVALAEPSAGARLVPSRPFAAQFGRGWQLLGLAASLAVVFVLGAGWGRHRAQGDFLIDDAISSHVHSLQLAHLIDVASTDQHTVKPWFAGKLDFSPPVADLAPEGFPLAGGRLEYFAGQSAAALVFHRRQHAINLFIQPVQRIALSTTGLSRAGDGHQVRTWTQDGFNFIAVSEISQADLEEFAEAFRRHIAGGSAAH